MENNGHVLAFMAHPDDIEILCAGVLIRLRQKGYTIHMATMTAGDGGSMELPGEEIARIRSQEAKKAAELVPADYHCAGQKDFLVRYHPSAIRKTVEIIRLCQPFLVITHSPVDYLLDHENTSQLVRNACFGAGAPNMKTNAVPAAPVLPGIPYLYYANPIENKDNWGQPVVPDRIYDISSEMDQKEAMLKCHASQRDWVLQHHGIDVVDNMRRWSGWLGKRIGASYGEGFRQHLGHAYPQDDKLWELLNS
ncbi:MAG: PIG-L family deacetylase [Acidobacteriota bacterium]